MGQNGSKPMKLPHYDWANKHPAIPAILSPIRQILAGFISLAIWSFPWKIPVF